MRVPSPLLLLLPALLPTLMLAGCDQAPSGDADVLGIGDSFFDMGHEAGDVPQVAGEQLGLEVENAAMGGETIFGGHPTSIPRQRVSGSYQWLVATGGGNDLGACDCGVDCDDTVDALIDEAGGGAIREIVEGALDENKRVVWVGYLRPTEDAEEFGDCDGELDTLRSRLDSLAGELSGLWFVDGIDYGNGTELELYEDDGYHPSPEGSRVLGEAVAGIIGAHR